MRCGLTEQEVKTVASEVSLMLIIYFSIQASKRTKTNGQPYLCRGGVY